MNNNRIASIDFGTNTARLLVAEKHANGRFEHIQIEREIVRMGGGFDREAGLSPEAIQRGYRCLSRFSKVLKELEVSNVRAVATSAVRDAPNGAEFIASIYRDTGITLRVIDGIQEGSLTLAGVLSGLDCQHKHLMVFDVGGGSTEYTLAHGGKAQFIRSLPLGVVRLTEGKGCPDEMVAKITKELDLLAVEMSSEMAVVDPNQMVLVGTAGTATTLAAVHLEMSSYDYRRVNNSLLSLDEIKRIYATLLPLTADERIAIPGLEKGREDLIIAGTLITILTMEHFGFTTLKVSDYGLLEGLIVTDEF